MGERLLAELSARRVSPVRSGDLERRTNEPSAGLKSFFKGGMMGYEWMEDMPSVDELTDGDKALAGENLLNFFNAIKKHSTGFPDIILHVTPEMLAHMVDNFGEEFTVYWIKGDIDKCISLAKSEEE